MAPTKPTNAHLFVPQVAPKDRRKNLKKTLRTMRKIASLRKMDDSSFFSQHLQDPEPLKLGQRIVLRSRGRVPVKVLAELNSLYKKDSIGATQLLATMMQGEPTDECNIYRRCLIRTLFEERLKRAAQLAGIFPPDPDLTAPAQELFEQFFKTHGLPNDTERDLLQEVGHVEDDVVDAWCKELRKSNSSDVLT